MFLVYSTQNNMYWISIKYWKILMGFKKKFLMSVKFGQGAWDN
jgi:hypothetical protein